MRDYFCGWYLKCQNQEQTVAVIPAYHIAGGKKSCSVQVITDGGSWNAVFPFSALRLTDSRMEIGGNRFGKDGLSLELDTPGLRAAGRLSFGPLAPIAYDIMGPFKYVPFMECRHRVFSMKHAVNGTLVINGVEYVFENGVGYMEGDRGYSFPKKYVWAQTCFPEGSLMLSAADIPFCGFHFTGVIGAIHYRGKEYRLGTYLGARVVSLQDGKVVVQQGRKKLTVQRRGEKGHPLAAPVGGKMTRTIHETAACKAYFHYEEKGETVFSLEADRAAFEYEYPR